MNSAAIQKLRAKLARDECVYGLWITLDAASIAEMAVFMGLDWIVLDAEHGHMDWGDLVGHLRAAVRSDTVVIIRVAELNIGLIKRALDIGADGVIIPWMETAEQVRQAVAFANFPPGGLRGIGAERATFWGTRSAEHVAEAASNVLVIPLIESVRGGANIEAMLDVPGVDLFWFGPADYSSTAGYAGQWEGPGVAEAIGAAKDKIRARGKHCGVIATSNENLLQRREQGFRLLAIGSDTGLLMRSARAALAAVGRDGGGSSVAPAATKLSAGAAAVVPLSRPPEAMRPDRSEQIGRVGEGPKLEVAPGIVFEALVGSHNTARRLTTGLVTLVPGAVLPYHTHTFDETITLLEGDGAVEVEGRRYHLAPTDNVTVPRGVAHSSMNLSSERPALLHIALSTDTPTRELVENKFTLQHMPDDSHGKIGAEHVARCRAAPVYRAGWDTAFVDYLNSDLLPGIALSGGYGLFQPGARLPAHLHDFDESICIVEGTATCFVEGRKYMLGDRATAMVPRGRVHYFINETDKPMAMIWVYAGPLPERIVVEERCATMADVAWPAAAASGSQSTAGSSKTAAKKSSAPTAASATPARR